MNLLELLKKQITVSQSVMGKKVTKVYVTEATLEQIKDEAYLMFDEDTAKRMMNEQFDFFFAGIPVVDVDKQELIFNFEFED